MRKETFEITWYEQTESIPESLRAFTEDGIFGILLTREKLIEKCTFYFAIYDFIVINGKYFRTLEDIPKYVKELTKNYYVLTEHNREDSYGNEIGLYAIVHTSDTIGIPDKNLKELFISLSK